MPTAIDLREAIKAAVSAALASFEPPFDASDRDATLLAWATSIHDHVVALGGGGGVVLPIAQADVTNLVADLAAINAAIALRSLVGHTHALADVTGLVAALAGKADAVHSHALSDVVGLVAALAGKSDVGHTHAQADVTNLVSDLAAINAALSSLQTQSLGGRFGTGIDGDVTLPAGTTTLTRIMFYNNLTVPNGAVLDPGRFPFYVLNTLTVEAGGAIRANGGDAPGGTSTAGGTAGGVAGTGMLGIGQAGQSGGTQNVAAYPAHINQPSGAPSTAVRGNAGGNGHTGGGATTAAQPTAPTITHSNGSIYVLDHARPGYLSHATNLVGGGPGGGGGAGDNSGLSNGSGAGGGGGGAVMAFGARTVVNNGAIEAKGGAGGSKSGVTSPGRGTGGGAGGDGGKVLRWYRSWSGSTPDVSGGAGGAGAGAGTSGAAGSDGLDIAWQV